MRHLRRLAKSVARWLPFRRSGTRSMMRDTSYCDVILDQLTPEERAEFEELYSMGFNGAPGSLRTLAESKILFHEGDEEKALRGIFLLEQIADHFNDQDSIIKLASIYEEGYHVEEDPDRAWEYYMRIIRGRRAVAQNMEPLWSSTEKWKKLGGGELETCLFSGAIRLLDAAWLVNHAFKSPTNTIGRRQDLPDEAFLSAMDVINASKDADIDFSRRLKIICLSYTWLDHDHPDPKGWTLSCLAEKLKPTLIEQVKNRSGNTNNIVYGIFWDFASLYQHPRDAEQDKLFKNGLEALSYMYSHPHTTVYKITKTPPGYPTGYKVADDEKLKKHAMVPYGKRGWPFTESCWSALTKSSEKTVDLSQSTSLSQEIKKIITEALEETPEDPELPIEEIAQNDVLHGNLFVKHFLETDMAMFLGFLLPDAVSDIMKVMSHTRNGPLSPDLFYEAIEACSFTNGHEDRKIVKELYRKFFVRHFKEAKDLDYRGMHWNDKQAMDVADVISRGYTQNLERLFLGTNFIQEKGCASIAEAILSHKAPRLTHLYLDFNLDLKDSGVRALAPAISSIQSLSMSGTFISAEGCTTIADALEEAGKSSDLRDLDLSVNPMIGDEGCKTLSRAISMLDSIDLSHCMIGNNGCRALINALLSKKVPLKKLDLSMNPIEDEGCEKLSLLVEQFSDSLEYLDLGDTLISDDLKEALQKMRFKGTESREEIFSGLRV